MRKRIEVSAEMDRALAKANALAEQFDELGEELALYYIEKFGGGVSNMEALSGINRRAAALPRFIRRLFPTFPYGQYTPLAQSEAAFWNIDPKPVANVKGKTKTEAA